MLNVCLFNVYTLHFLPASTTPTSNPLCEAQGLSAQKATYFTPRLSTVPTNCNCNPLSYTQLWRHFTQTVLTNTKLHMASQCYMLMCNMHMTWPHKHVYTHMSHKRVRKYASQCCMPCNDKTTQSCLLLSSLFSPSLILPSSLPVFHFWLSLFLKSCAHPGMINSFKFSLIVQNIWIQPRTVLYEPPESESNLDFSSEILLQATTQIQSGKQPHKYKVAKNNTNAKWQTITQIGNTFCPCLCLAVFHLTAMYICLTRALGHTWYLCVCDVENVSTNVQFMLFCCKISFIAIHALSRNMFWIVHFCVQKNWT